MFQIPARVLQAGSRVPVEGVVPKPGQIDGFQEEPGEAHPETVQESGNRQCGDEDRYARRDELHLAFGDIDG